MDCIFCSAVTMAFSTKRLASLLNCALGYFHILSSLACYFSYSVELLDSLMCFSTAGKSKLCHHLEILLPLFYEVLGLFLEALIMYALCNFTIQLLKTPGT